MDMERKIWLQENAEQLLADAEVERGFALTVAWRDTLLSLLKVHGVDMPAVNRILDTIEGLEREAGRMPTRPPLNVADQ